MANIEFNVAERVCEKPVITDAHAVEGRENEFSISWTSLGEIYQLTDPNVTIELYISIDDAPYELYTGSVIGFNENDLVIDFNNTPLTPPISYVDFMVVLNSDYCGREDSATVRVNSIA